MIDQFLGILKIFSPKTETVLKNDQSTLNSPFQSISSKFTFSPKFNAIPKQVNHRKQPEDEVDIRTALNQHSFYIRLKSARNGIRLSRYNYSKILLDEGKGQIE